MVKHLWLEAWNEEEVVLPKAENRAALSRGSPETVKYQVCAS